MAKAARCELESLCTILSGSGQHVPHKNSKNFRFRRPKWSLK